MVLARGKTVWVSALIAALLFIGFDAALRLKSLDTVAPASSRAHHQILESDDGYHWVKQTQQMLARGEWRVRSVDYDNAPAGRAVHWSSPPHWWLAGVALAHAALTDLAPPAAVERAALYANPLWFALFLVALSPWASRHFGATITALLTLGLTVSVPFAVEFGAGSFDHHGFAAASALVTVLGLLAGWRATDPAGARRAFILSGVAGAVGLWINAASQIPVLVGVGGGALLALSTLSRDSAARLSPDLWRWWGGAGALTALLAYALEYFPTHLGLRLEVNHPLHALAWAAAGDGLARFHRVRAGGRWFTSTPDRALALTGALALLAPAGLAFGFSAHTFVVRDPQLWRLHADYISEFASPLAGLRGGGWSQLQLLFVQWNALPLVVGVAAFVPLLRTASTERTRATLCLTLVPALLLFVMAMNQQRWLSLACAGWLACAVAVLAARGETRSPSVARRVWFVVLVALVLAPYPLYLAARTPAVLRGHIAPSTGNRHQLALRDTAHWLERRALPGETLTVLSGPSATTSLLAFSPQLRGVGTLYWENLAGLHATIATLGTTSPDEARRLFAERGITHLVVCSWVSFARESARLRGGLPASAPPPANAFLLKLLNSRDAPPAWLRPLFYRLPPKFAGTETEREFVFVFEYAPDQSPALAAVRRAQFLAAQGALAEAEALLRDTLATSPALAPALIALAQLQVQTRAVDALRETLPRLRAALAATPTLDAEDRVLAALVLAATRAQPEAAVQLTLAWRDLDERALRRLAPGTLRILLRLTRDLSVTAPPASLALAETLQAADSPPPAT